MLPRGARDRANNPKVDAPAANCASTLSRGHCSPPYRMREKLWGDEQHFLNRHVAQQTSKGDASYARCELRKLPGSKLGAAASVESCTGSESMSSECADG